MKRYEKKRIPYDGCGINRATSEIVVKRRGGYRKVCVKSGNVFRMERTPQTLWKGKRRHEETEIRDKNATAHDMKMLQKPLFYPK